jgi:hypothetical protein
LLRKKEQIHYLFQNKAMRMAVFERIFRIIKWGVSQSKSNVKGERNVNTKKAVAYTPKQASVWASSLILLSKWFVCTPLPGNRFQFEVINESGIPAEILARSS